MNPALGLSLGLLAVAAPVAGIFLLAPDPGGDALSKARKAVAAHFAQPDAVRLKLAVVYRKPDGSEVVCGVASAPNPLTGLRIERSFYAEGSYVRMPPEPGEYAFDRALVAWSEDYDKACNGEVIKAT